MSGKKEQVRALLQTLAEVGTNIRDPKHFRNYWKTPYDAVHIDLADAVLRALLDVKLVGEAHAERNRRDAHALAMLVLDDDPVDLRELFAPASSGSEGRPKKSSWVSRKGPELELERVRSIEAQAIFDEAQARAQPILDAGDWDGAFALMEVAMVKVRAALDGTTTSSDGGTRFTKEEVLAAAKDPTLSKRPEGFASEPHKVISGTQTPARATAFRDAAHVKAFLDASGRSFIVMRSSDLVDALPWPDGVEALQQIIACYGQHRAEQSTGWVGPTPLDVKATCARNGTPCPEEMEIMKDEQLTIDEVSEAIAHLSTLRAVLVEKLTAAKARRR